MWLYLLKRGDKMKKGKQNNGRRQISFSPVLWYSVLFCLLTLFVILLGGAVLSLHDMKADTQVFMKSVHTQITQRINESITLLNSLAALPEYYDPAIDPIVKVKKLDKMAPEFGYMMICYVDQDITVYSDGSEPASLASRDYMQQLFSTGNRQVTDSFAAGADGVTLNYTVAVPLYDEKKNITGCLFCAIYFDEIVKILEDSAHIDASEAVLVGSQGQIMSSIEGQPYGDSIMDQFRGTTLFGTTADKLQEQLLAQIPGNFWSIRNGNLYFTTYQRVDHTGWDVLCSVSFEAVFRNLLPCLLLVMVLTVLLCIGLMLLIRRYIAKQMQIINTLTHSVEELEKKIFQDERPDCVDFNEIIRLTGDGLSDSLTGVVTRSVFLNQATALLKKANPDMITALCFVDMDNLKHINDTYGHSTGDMALKSVGYILREYEKRYDGVVGRYGGDEFVMLLTGLDDELELRGVLEELVLRLHSEVGLAGQRIPVQCSIGVAQAHTDTDLEQLIADADEALYFVKQNGKGYYKIYQN